VVRVAEITATLSLATDLGMGYPLEHGLRSTLIALGLAERLDLDRAALREVYDVSQLLYIGCTVETHVFAGFFGDELEARAAAAPVVWGRPAELQRAFLGRLGAGQTGIARLAAAARALPDVKRELDAGASGHCEVARMLGARLGLQDDHSAAFAAIYERWDGKGFPGRLRGEDIPLAVRVLQVADDADVQQAAGGSEHAARTLAARAGHAFDPAIARTFAEHAHELLRLPPAAWEATLAAEPAPVRTLDDEGLDTALGAVADFADLKSPYLLGHSRAVSELVTRAAERAGLTERAQASVRRAALVQDVGRVAVSVTTWDKASALTVDDWERIRLHPYHGERILARAEALAEPRALAALHHERLDGSGYHRGATAAGIPFAGRLLAAADVYRAMLARRPHRPALPPEEAAVRLEHEARSGRLDGDAVAAVLSAAGQGARRPARPAGLTDREVEVLRLLAEGRMTKQVARELGISPKTADHHVQAIYGKIGVSTRAGATLFAMRSGLAGPGELPMAAPPARA
jgi:HD-GYP domain-containing protein (c-di-GMP phosphodiesterase class II)